MKNRWDVHQGKRAARDALAARVYTSRLLGQDPALALHGGGNTSVKMTLTTLLEDTEEILYIKGSGWDLATIEKGGFAPVKLSVARRLAALPRLSDTDMVRQLRAAMLDPAAPTPSVETLLHALIPLRYVDHTHADAVVTITQTPRGEDRLRDIYGERVLVMPYVMPGFDLARAAYAMMRHVDWQKLDGIILAHHGVLTFGQDAKSSYDAMIRLVSEAEDYMRQHRAMRVVASSRLRLRSRLALSPALIALARLRRAVSRAAGSAMLARLDDAPAARQFASQPRLRAIATRGPLTPDHVLRTKRIPMIVSTQGELDVARYAAAYRAYFKRHSKPNHVCLDVAPRWALWPGQGSVSFGRAVADARIVADIARHTMRAIQQAEALGGYRALHERDIFDVEYWSLEQAKLKQAGALPVLQGKIALVTGAASGIGAACVEALRAQGAVVAALDINPAITARWQDPAILGMVCDMTQPARVQQAIQAIVRSFGGLDIVISNAGLFPASASIAQMNPSTWQQSMAVNLNSHQRLLQACWPYLSLGLDAAAVIIGSKNVPAPGPGAAAYSVAKAGLTQLGRVAALEWAQAGIRVNMIHPNQVFDTAIWTPRVLAARARQYGLSVAAYQTRNLLRVAITSRDVAALACALAGPVFAKTTGAQIPIDGGNDRVI